MTTTADIRRRARRPLPRRIRPLRNETTISFVQRLARANHIRADELIEYLDAGMTTSGRHISASPQVLADTAGMDVGHLLQALPQLQVAPGPASSHVTSAEVRLACRRCMAARNIFYAVTVLAWTDQNVCPRHQLWVGQGVTTIADQADISGLPDIGRAHVRHQRLARRHGLWRVWDCYNTAESTIDWSTRETSSRSARQDRIRRFLAVIGNETLPRSYDYAAYYPEVVGVLSVLASPHWRRMASSGQADDALRFYHQVAANGLTSGTPRENTPLRSWIVKLRAERELGSG
jgi:TniQ